MTMKRLFTALAVSVCLLGSMGCCCHQKYYCGSTVSPAFCKPRHFHSCNLSGGSICSTVNSCDCGCP
ncbi:MAG: hypothetical protein LW700_01980 [Gemmataceae bacterium]|nr:hypothetical protein [Gemmataceae bacterium]